MECASHAGAFAARSHAVDEARLRPPKAGAWLPHSTQVLWHTQVQTAVGVYFLTQGGRSTDHLQPSGRRAMQVTYNAQVCIHAGNCVKSLPTVFKVVDGQFVIDQQGAREAAIRQTVAACPSGALQITED